MDDFIFIVSIIIGIGCIFMCIAFAIHEIAEARFYRTLRKYNEKHPDTPIIWATKIKERKKKNDI